MGCWMRVWVGWCGWGEVRKGGSCTLLRIPAIHQTEGDVFRCTTKRTMLSLPHLIIAPLAYPSGLDLPGDAAAFADRQARRHRLGSKGLVVEGQRSGGWDGHDRGTCVTPTRAFLRRALTGHNVLFFFCFLFCHNAGIVNLRAADKKGCGQGSSRN